MPTIDELVKKQKGIVTRQDEDLAKDLLSDLGIAFDSEFGKFFLQDT